MRLITRNTDYAVRALCVMAKDGRRIITVSELALQLRIPRPFLRKILQILNKNKLLESYKGKSGGFRLAREADKIFLFDLIKILQGPVKLNQCIFSKAFCPDIKVCSLKKKIEDIERYVIKELESVTIASLCNDRRGGIKCGN